MITLPKLFLSHDSFNEEWSVLDKENTCYGTGDTPEDAIKSARVVTNATIYANSQFKGIVDGEPVLTVRYLTDVDNETVLYGAEEMIEAMAELGGFKAYKVFDEDGFLMGYSFEVVE